MKNKVVEYEGKTIVIKPAPATVAYDVALRYREALEKNDSKALQTCLYDLLEYAELKLEDGRNVTLDDKTLFNQHFASASTLVGLQKDVVAVNFNFLEKGTPSDS